ncbi:MAG: hypothetical protein WAS27_03390 [Candidatus Saccharimonadales bacterium]
MPSKQTARKPRHRTYARNRAASVRRAPAVIAESDGTYFLKLIIVVMLGTLWLKLTQPISWQGIPFGGFPLGAMIGLIGISLLEKDQSNRKIWYAVLIIVTIVSYFVPAGIVI